MSATFRSLAVLLLCASWAAPVHAQGGEDAGRPGAGQQGRAGPPVEFLGPQEDRYPFSEAVRVGHLLFLSGAIGVDPETGELVPGGIGPETRQTLENIRATLERHGSALDRVVKCTAMLADMDEWPAMNEVYADVFEAPRPARSAFGATALALGARVEIECIAVAQPGERPDGTQPGPAPARPAGDP